MNKKKRKEFEEATVSKSKAKMNFGSLHVSHVFLLSYPKFDYSTNDL